MPSNSVRAKQPKTETFLILAKDIDGQWWDGITEKRVRGKVNDYVASRLKKEGLGGFADAVFKVGRLSQPG
jgi:hypothetical protein